MANMLIVAVIFIVLLLIIAGFVSQQFSTAQKIVENKRPKSLLEKMNKGIGALDTDKFRQIVMEGGPDELSGQVEALIDESDRTSASSANRGIDEMPNDMAFESDIDTGHGSLNLEGKDLQTIYAEYLSEKNVNPFDMEPEFKLGVAYLKFSQFEKAIKQFEKVVVDKPEFPGIHYYLGEAYRCNGQFYEAMKAYKSSWELESKAEANKSQDK
jgi:tetratricopeptide (TPR) repeat protein